MFAWAGMWVSGKLAGLGGRLAEVVVALALLLALVGGPYWLGVRNQERADALREAQRQAAAEQKLAAAQVKGEAVASRLQTEKEESNVVYRTLVREVPRVVTVYRPAPGASERALPRCVFTRAYVGVWNAALRGADELSASAGGAAAAAGGAGAAGGAAESASTDAGAEVDSGLGQAEVLRNHVDNAAQCEGMRQQLDALIDWHAAVDR